jgi:hypothetical protein
MIRRLLCGKPSLALVVLVFACSLLPLGLDFATGYEKASFRLAIGDRLTLYTDGLLEARNTAGDLFSFDRLRAQIATQPDAKQATDAAVAFGQDDDITVITFTRLAPGVESTTSLLAPALVSSDAWFSRGSNQP